MTRRSEAEDDWTNDPRYLHGIGLFNSGHYFDAHEVLEEVWRAGGAEEKKFLQGLIQVAVALHHHSTGNLAGACSLIARGRRNLEAYPPRYGGIELRRFLNLLRLCEEALQGEGLLPAAPLISRTARPSRAAPTHDDKE
ncbi:MAG TPA: DUF309 domain-containing protein [Terriglobales bacterium]|nr:DUF309 domain-containing protein [Terriglobales bacterium]